MSQARDQPMRDWKASHVLAWLEIDINMPLYGKTCSENIKSGKVTKNMYLKYCFKTYDLVLFHNPIARKI